MFRNRTEELSHLIKLYERCLPSLNDMTEQEKQHLETTKNLLLLQIESFSNEMIKNMIEKKVLDLQFANKVYEFDGKLFSTIFNNSISTFYTKIGFNHTLRIVGEVMYFHQAIEGYKTIYEQMKDNLENLKQESYELSEKLKRMISMKDFDKLPEDEKSRIDEMIKSLQPYAVLPEPVKYKRRPNWAEHYLRLALLENSQAEEENKFYSLFRTET